MWTGPSPCPDNSDEAMQASVSSPRAARSLWRGFTLIELLVSMAVLSVLFLLVSSVVSSVQRGWRQTTSTVSQFREARKAFDRLVNTISQAELNNYLCYRYQNSSDPLVPPSQSQVGQQPSGYVRYSELQFICGPTTTLTAAVKPALTSDNSPGHAIFFQAPLGSTSNFRLPSSLNGCGFYLKFGDDSDSRPPFLTQLQPPKLPLYRYRLYEYRSPTENNRSYDPTSGPNSPWYSDYASYSQPVANNIVLLLFSPQEAATDSSSGKLPTEIAPNFIYNSTPTSGVGGSTQGNSDYQLPPLMNITMVAIDEASAESLELVSKQDAPLKAELSNSGLFTSAANLQQDLNTLSNSLVSRKINFRIFTATVPIRASKWGKGTLH